MCLHWKLEGKEIPVRREGPLFIVPLPPGKQTVEAAWTNDEALQTLATVGAVALPVAGANVSTVLQVPENRWVLWADGPLRRASRSFLDDCGVRHCVGPGSWQLIAIATKSLAMGSAGFGTDPSTRGGCHARRGLAIPDRSARHGNRRTCRAVCLT